MNPQPNLKLWGLRIAIAAAMALVLALLIVKKLKAVPTADLTPGRVFELLGTLLVLALLLERSLEVFVTAWRGPDADKLRLKVAQCARVERQFELLPAAERTARATDITKAETDLRSAEQQELEYKTVTQRHTLGAALVLGTLISAIGFRTLERLVVPGSLADLAAWQRTAFMAVDVVLTGSVIAGGSDGLHKMINAMIRFFDETTKRLRAAG